ncbi:MAG: N-acetylmuramoyl-L-alanine amidase [Bdellovibrionales bacterium]|nr:N-acetylmuramoyl-L-alanine amidase [Bdellovibrionales bacterium]
MQVSNRYSSPNFSPDLIPVEFVVLHYTAADLRRTMDIFGDPARKVCAHFVLDTDGTVYDLGGFLTGPVKKGAHAGESFLTIDGTQHTALNANSIGIEIVNLNGNLFPYTDAQYAALEELLKALVQRFAILKQPSRIIGHEQIAGHRGKCDPGVQFQWERVLLPLGIPLHANHRHTVFNEDDLKFAQDLMRNEPQRDEHFWSKLSAGLEQRIKARQQG